MPFSSSEGKGFFKDWVETFAIHQGYSRYLDIGCGGGHYGKILKSLSSLLIVDGVEIFPEYIEKYNLRYVYDFIVVGDIREPGYPIDSYDVIIMGDVLEHMTKNDAVTVIERLKTKCRFIWCALPMKFDRPWSTGYAQHECEYEENISEQHLHDWTVDELKEAFSPLWVVPYAMTGTMLIEGDIR